MLKEGFEIYQRYYGESHVYLAWMSVNLGNVYRELGEYGKAKSLLEHSFIIYKNDFHNEHIDIGWNLLELGRIDTALKDYTKAQDLLNHSLKIYKKHYGEDHIQTAKVLNALGENYLLEGKLDTAETLFNQALVIFQKTEHPEVYEVLEDLAALYIKKAKEVTDLEQRQKFKNQAIDYLKQADEIIKTRFPAASPHSKRIQSKLQELEQ